MPYAYCLIRSDPVYRREAFEAGLRSAGYTLRTAANGLTEHGNVMVGWNRYGAQAALADRFEAAGGTYLCAENAYIWTGGVSPHHLKDRPAYALSRGWHNDASVIPEVGPERWNALGVAVKPWRATGEHVLVCPNRPFGVPGRAMPANWTQDVASRLRKLTKREIRVRPHPGNDPPLKPLAEDLLDCWAVIVWSSSAGVHALVAGIPVFCEAPYWICKSAAFPGSNAVDSLLTDEPGTVAVMTEARQLALHRLAHAQYSLAEIESGEAFRAVLA